MKIFVDKKPETCSACLFLGSIPEAVALFTGEPKCKLYSGCTLLKNKIPMEIAFTNRLDKCPLREIT